MAMHHSNDADNFFLQIWHSREWICRQGGGGGAMSISMCKNGKRIQSSTFWSVRQSAFSASERSFMRWWCWWGHDCDDGPQALKNPFSRLLLQLERRRRRRRKRRTSERPKKQRKEEEGEVKGGLQRYQETERKKKKKKKKKKISLPRRTWQRICHDLRKKPRSCTCCWPCRRCNTDTRSWGSGEGPNWRPRPRAPCPRRRDSSSLCRPGFLPPSSSSSSPIMMIPPSRTDCGEQGSRRGKRLHRWRRWARVRRGGSDAELLLLLLLLLPHDVFLPSTQNPVAPPL